MRFLKNRLLSASVPMLLLAQCAPTCAPTGGSDQLTSHTMQTFVCGNEYGDDGVRPLSPGIHSDVCWILDCDNDDYNRTIDRRCLADWEHTSTGVNYVHYVGDERRMSCLTRVIAYFDPNYTWIDITFVDQLCGGMSL